MILSDIRHGVTVIEGKGGYTRQQEHILYTVITFRELSELKRAIQQLDPNAFVVVKRGNELPDRQPAALVTGLNQLFLHRVSPYVSALSGASLAQPTFCRYSGY